MPPTKFIACACACAIASVVMKSVKFVAQKEKGGLKSMDADFFKLCRKTLFISHPQKVDHDASSVVENVEVYSSFRPSVSATITAEKLEQILVSSDSESEPEETGQSHAGGVKKDASAGVTSSAADMDAIAKWRAEKSARTRILAQRNACTRTRTKTLRSGQAISSTSMLDVLTNQLTKLNSHQAVSNLLSSNPIFQVQTVPIKTWKLGVQRRCGGYVICPGEKCSSPVQYKNILKHLSKLHPTISTTSLLCPVCKISVLPSAVRAHMHSCSPPTATVQPTTARRYF